jgi:hypothetical protein
MFKILPVCPSTPPVSKLGRMDASMQQQQQQQQHLAATITIPKLQPFPPSCSPAPPCGQAWQIVLVHQNHQRSKAFHTQPPADKPLHPQPPPRCDCPSGTAGMPRTAVPQQCLQVARGCAAQRSVIICNCTYSTAVFDWQGPSLPWEGALGSRARRGAVAPEFPTHSPPPPHAQHANC